MPASTISRPAAMPHDAFDWEGETITAIDRRLDEIDRLSHALDAEEVQPAIEQGAEAKYEFPPGFRLSVVIPVYNERDTIEKVVRRIDQLPVDTEIIVVDDCSTDGTRDVLARIAHYIDLKIKYHDQNQGKGAALRTGFEAATGEVVVVQDADLEYDPRDILTVIRPILDGEADVAYGSRFSEARHANSSWIHRAGNRFLTWLSNFTTGLQITDMETCYKAIRIQALRSVTIEQDRFGFEPEITAKLARRKFRFVERPISYNARSWKSGKKIGIRDALQAIWCIFHYGWRD
ncbi:glycosyltransferase family 2 protein [Blastopirellula sp. JC732]|uniref:Glycosyltransferase family 2 protein n=1 Tax=Blastopirellula sediminis TaxID=2894196 RepID=A0A9X1SI01_9BACT|nr:glycosyltransferase family 2 protein [Blastopirellula sediminis]MCC9606346.1 glycosyltransferase family 2 protein [Blastopirellula sediminis]MCC9630356.1 glycosyltransferase family 2 protein [Blastopirellula sediminis]